MQVSAHEAHGVVHRLVLGLHSRHSKCKVNSTSPAQYLRFLAPASDLGSAAVLTSRQAFCTSGFVVKSNATHSGRRSHSAAQPAWELSPVAFLALVSAICPTWQVYEPTSRQTDIVRVLGDEMYSAATKRNITLNIQNYRSVCSAMGWHASMASYCARDV